MGIDTAIEYADELLYERTGKHLSDLQSHILQHSWQGRTYGQVAKLAGYSEGHVKDVASQLWKLLSEALGERVTKGNLRSRLKHRIKRTIKSAPGSATVIAGIRSWQVQTGQPQRTVTSETSVDSTNLNFFGRQAALETLHTLSQTHRLIVIQGEGGLGKTTLAQQYAQQFEQVLELLMAKETDNITPVESVVEEWLRQTYNEEPGREFGVTLSRLKHHLQARPACILIDNLEPALDSSGQFVTRHRRYVELLRVLAATPATVIITSRDRLCEPSIPTHHYRLPCLTLDAWQQFFQQQFLQTHQLDFQAHRDSLTQMHRAYGGNAKAMEILCAAVIEDFEGDLRAYWRENGTDLLGTADLRNLLGSQVNRLQQLDTDAYRVFCRLGCYRYQEQPRLKADAIAALMWDIAPNQQKQTLNSLRDRSLLEFRRGEYWLHPVSRAEAIARLRESEDWQSANQAAATYWSTQTHTITSVEEGLQALEAYYHLIAAKDYDAAAAVLLKSRHNQWRQFLPLASSLYRMGLLQPVISAITQVLPHVRTQRSELNNILGDVYWITGDIHSAIACQKQTLTDTAHKLATLTRTKEHSKQDSKQQNAERKKNHYYLKMLTVDAHLSLGLYCVDLWELTQAAEQFEQVISLATGSAHQAWADKATVGLALVRAYQGQVAVATELASNIVDHFTAGPDDQHGRYAYFLQLLGQAFGALEKRQRAQELYQRAIASAEASHYLQIKAKALTGLAVLKRQQGDCEGAIAIHQQAIERCEEIGAKCDTAEAYLQFGLSAQHCDAQSPTAYFQRASNIFASIQAPRQVERVKRTSLSQLKD